MKAAFLILFFAIFASVGLVMVFLVGYFVQMPCLVVCKLQKANLSPSSKTRLSTVHRQAQDEYFTLVNTRSGRDMCVISIENDYQSPTSFVLDRGAIFASIAKVRFSQKWKKFTCIDLRSRSFFCEAQKTE